MKDVIVELGVIIEPPEHVVDPPLPATIEELAIRRSTK